LPIFSVLVASSLPPLAGGFFFLESPSAFAVFYILRPLFLSPLRPTLFAVVWTGVLSSRGDFENRGLRISWYASTPSFFPLIDCCVDLYMFLFHESRAGSFSFECRTGSLGSFFLFAFLVRFRVELACFTVIFGEVGAIDAIELFLKVVLL